MCFKLRLREPTRNAAFTLFLDLTTFYETISHQRLVQSALEFGVPGDAT